MKWQPTPKDDPTPDPDSSVDLSQYYTVDEVTGCWVWHGPRGCKGHGRLKISGHWKTAQRLMFEQVHRRPVRAGYLLHHKCFNTPCVNPEHLEELTMLQHKTHHPGAGRTTTQEQADWVRLWLNAGFSSASIGRSLSLSTATVNDIKAGRTYKS